MSCNRVIQCIRLIWNHQNLNYCVKTRLSDCPVHRIRKFYLLSASYVESCLDFNLYRTLNYIRVSFKGQTFKKHQRLAEILSGRYCACRNGHMTLEEQNFVGDRIDAGGRFCKSGFKVELLRCKERLGYVCHLNLGFF